MIKDTFERNFLSLKKITIKSIFYHANKFFIFFEICPSILQHPWQEYSSLQIDFMIYRNVNIRVISTANLLHVENVLLEKLRIQLCLVFLLSKSLTWQDETFLFVYKTKIF